MIKQVSLKDIAKKVGVSTALVSYVISGKEKDKKVSAKVAQRIRQAAKDLKYQPNAIARSLRKGTTKTIGLVIADIANPFFGQLCRVIEDEAQNYDYVVIIGSSDEDHNKSELLINAMHQRQVDGFIIVPAENTIEQIQDIIQKKIPVVLVDRYFNELNTNYIVLDNYKATFNSTLYLIKSGYKSIAFMAYKSSLVHMMERIRGYFEAMSQSGLTDKINLIELKISNTQNIFENTLNKLLTSDKKIDAIIFANNMLSIAGLHYLHKQNIRIPEELAIIGFDGGDCFDLFYSPITYVKQPIEDIGKEAIRTLMDLIHDGSNKTSHIILNPELVIRNSC
jgi:LacI family transcriptional regulator